MRRSLLFPLLAAALVLAACSGSDGAETTTTAPSSTISTTAATTRTSTTTTSSTSTSTTTLPSGPPSPLNGLPVADEDLLDRRVIAVKVDNHPDARPQSGLQEADAVIEIIVEGGFTRLIALFHHSDSDYVGPVRSVRPTDSALLAILDAPLVTSGGQAWIQALANERGIPLIGEGAVGLFRMSHRRAPHNLYADTREVRATADARGYDDDINGPLYAIGEWEEPEEAAESITFDWGYGHTDTWTYQDGRYLRFEGTRAHEWVDRSGEGAQLAFDVLVAIESHQYAAGPAGGGGASVPAVETLGTGRLLIFADGKVMEGTWERDAVDESYRLFDGDGNPAVVPPGIPWICLFPQERTITWS
ncbi:MAG TPA: DUF3048 domain-containing protein [Acidimicrobiia bacterium]|nr:DUF3048 domain-containing protein [Acidimicrobiia bacterium]